MKRRFMSYERLAAIASDALLKGYGRLEPHPERPWDFRQRFITLRLEMGCEDPYPSELFARTRKIEGRKTMTVVIHSRCRKCFTCKRNTSRMWAGKAITEYHRAARNWLGTFTASPEVHERWDLEIECNGLGTPGVPGWRAPINVYSLSETERFEFRARKFGEYITKWLKVIRKGESVPLAGVHVKPKVRYLLIAEAHESDATSSMMAGRPHYHILLHEQDACALIIGDPQIALMKGRSYEMERRMVQNKRTGRWEPKVFAHDNAFLRKAWDFGHTKFRLCDSVNSAVYPCKYITKAMRTRVRPSNGYGVTEG